MKRQCVRPQRRELRMQAVPIHARAIAQITVRIAGGGSNRGTMTASWGSHHAAALAGRLPSQSAAGRALAGMARNATTRRADARSRFLNRGTWHVPERTKHAAIARLRLQQSFASRTFVEILAGVRGHRFGCLTPADRASERRDRFQREHKRHQLFGAEGYPASVVARTSMGIAALASS